jgi:hypothetical protein
MKIKIIKNRLIPFGKYIAMAMYPFIFIRKRKWNKCSKTTQDRILNHEKIHFAQQKELTPPVFYAKYLYWWPKYGYRNIPFEKEAYANENDLTYLEHREKHAYKKYI